MSVKPRLECYFDCSSPWTYIGFHNTQPMAERLGVEIEWKPIIVGGVFNKVNQAVYENRANPPSLPKAAYTQKDLQDWARFSGLTINHPPACGHPVNAVKCMRACLVVQPLGHLIAFARSAFEALWIHGRDLALDEVLSDLARAVEVDPAWLLAEIARPETKAKLWDNTNELMARGGFGSPTFFVGAVDMYFGNDRLVLVEDAIRRLSDITTSASAAI